MFNKGKLKKWFIINTKFYPVGLICYINYYSKMTQVKHTNNIQLKS